MREVLRTPLQLDPHLYLFSISPEVTGESGSAPPYIPKWATISMLSARRGVMRNWAAPDPPSLREIQDLGCLFHIERVDTEIHHDEYVKTFDRRWHKHTFDDRTITDAIRSYTYTL